MAVLKPGSKIEKPTLDFESSRGLGEKEIPAQEKEKIKRLEDVRKAIISEIEQMNNLAPAKIGPVASIMAAQSKQQKQIENILASGLNEIYLSLAPEKQKIIKKTGEETARKINKLLSKARINIGAIVKLIKKWLSLIPGINRYFIEQEAKIKADEIIKIKKLN